VIHFIQILFSSAQIQWILYVKRLHDMILSYVINRILVIMKYIEIFIPFNFSTFVC